MNNKTEKMFESLDLPEITLQKHKKKLRKQLLTIYSLQTQRGGDIPFMKKKLFRYSAIGFVSLAIVAVITYTTLLPKTPQVQAQEIVSDAMNHVIKLSDEQRKTLEARIKADLQGSLEEAKNAKDLTVVPEEEIQRIDPPKEAGNKDVFLFKARKEDGMGKIVQTEDVQIGAPKEGAFKPGTRIEFAGKVMAPHGVKVLRYTNPEGKKVILGINEQNEPVMKMMFISKEDVKGLQERENIHFERAL